MKRFSVTFFLIICFASSVLAQCEDENCGLVISGKVTKIKLDKSQKRYIYFDVKLEIEFKNEGKEPIILIKPNVANPNFKGRYWLGGTSLSVTEKGKSICSKGIWESLTGDTFYTKLGEKLDVTTPPSDHTKILMPNETWSFSDEAFLGTVRERSYQNSDDFIIEDGYTACKSWKEIQEFSSPLWLSVEYELLPWNVERFRPKLFLKLKERWKDFGHILINKGEEDDFSSFRISSEPMMIEFGKVKGNDSKQ